MNPEAKETREGTGARQPTREALIELRRAATDDSYVSLGSRRTASRHEFYRYPARFTPDFARAAISAFSGPGDTILDPFVGGGTTAVEAQDLDRHAVASDINPLATFVTRVKTASWTPAELRAVSDWAQSLDVRLKLGRQIELPAPWMVSGYMRNLNSPEVWRIRNLIALALEALSDLPLTVSDLARCAILRTGQWAVDMTAAAPTAPEFRAALRRNLDAMVSVAAATRRGPSGTNVTIATEPVPGIESAGVLVGRDAPRLLLTSPPYPGVYVLYHRWKVLGRRESPAPYWVANALDGHGLSHYTMGHRFDPDVYFVNTQSAFRELGRLIHRDGWIVQMVGFKDPDNQLSRYLSVLESVGLSEVRFEDLATEDDGRLWREVPHRRWWTQNDGGAALMSSTAREVVLVHRLRG